MNKEKIMEFISNAIDQGANIDIFFNGWGRNEEQAIQTAKEFETLVDGETIKQFDKEFKSHWYVVRTKQFRLDSFYSLNPLGFMEEDVDFGGDDHAA